MKRTLIGVLFLCLAGIILPAKAAVIASGTCGENLTWMLLEGDILHISGSGEMADYDYSNNPWSTYKAEIKTVQIEQGVTSIGDYAFDGCYSLTSVTLPESVTRIGDRAFLGCSSLTSVTLPENVTSIGDYAFDGCYSLISVTIPEGVTSIGSEAFFGCSSLATVTIPQSVTSIGEWAFHGCSSLISVTIPKGVTRIEDAAFGGCPSLITILVEDGNPNYSAKNGMLFNKDQTILIQYPAGKSEVTYAIPEGVTSVWSYAFLDCINLTSVSIPESVTSIGDGAFADCSALASVSIPKGVTSIGSYAFQGTAFYENESNWNNGTLYVDHCLLGAKKDLSGAYSIVAGTRVIAGGAFAECESVASITIPEGVLSIGSEAFFDCSSLAYISIPESVTSIGEYAFYYCTGLTSITLPNSVTSIGMETFFGCSSLTSVSISESVTSIESGVFYECESLTSVTIPKGVTSIGVETFFGCTGLTQMTVLATTPPAVGMDAFYNVIREIPVYVPAESLDAYQNADVWKEFNLQAMNGSTGLGSVAALEQSIEVCKGEIILNRADRPLVSLYDLGGRLVLQSHDNRIAVPQFGIYIVRVGKEAVKIAVR